MPVSICAVAATGSPGVTGEPGSVGEPIADLPAQAASSRPLGMAVPICAERRGEDYTGARVSGEVRTSSSQPAFTGAFIEKPFGGGRRALAELLPPAREDASHGSAGWSGVASEASTVWGLEEHDHQWSTMRESSDDRHERKSAGASPLGHEGERHRGVHDEAARPPRFSCGDDSVPRSAAGARPALGLDLARIRAAERDTPAAIQPVPRESSSATNLEFLATSLGTGGTRPVSLLPGRRSGDGPGDWVPQSWGEEFPAGAAGSRSSGAADSSTWDVGWGHADGGAEQPVWGEDCGEGGVTEVRHSWGLYHSGENADNGFPPETRVGWSWCARPLERTEREHAFTPEGVELGEQNVYETNAGSSGEVRPRLYVLASRFCHASLQQIGGQSKKNCRYYHRPRAP